MIKRILTGVAVIGLTATASAVTFSGTSGSLSAQATFTISGSTVTILLENTSTADVTVPSQLLTGIFWDMDPNPTTLTPNSAVLPSGSTVWFGPNGGGNVGGEWAFKTGPINVSTPTGTFDFGTSTAGLGIFGQANYNGSNLSGQTAVQGMNYGITSLGDNPAVGNNAVTGQFPLIHNAVLFTLTGNPAAAWNFTNVRFQYGTAQNEGAIITLIPSDNPRVPDASTTVSLLGMALMGLGALQRRLRK